MVNAGANDGFFSSNSYPFIRRNWSTLLVEPNPVAFARARKLHEQNIRVTVLNVACGDAEEAADLILFDGDDGGSQSGFATGCPHPGRPVTGSISVEVLPLEKILGRHEIDPHFGLLSIDTGGYDYKVLQGLNLERFRPRVIITERNADDPAKFGFLRKHGYNLVGELEFDTIWTTG